MPSHTPAEKKKNVAANKKNVVAKKAFPGASPPFKKKKPVNNALKK